MVRLTVKHKEGDYVETQIFNASRGKGDDQVTFNHWTVNHLHHRGNDDVH